MQLYAMLFIETLKDDYVYKIFFSPGSLSIDLHFQMLSLLFKDFLFNGFTLC